jgi:site-specific recombinase XerD
MELVPKAEFSIFTRASSKAWIPELIAAAGPEVTETYIEDFAGSKPTVKQKLAAVRMLYDFLVVRQITPSNPAHSVRGPKYVVKKGKTPVWSREDAKTLLDSIPKDSVSGFYGTWRSLPRCSTASPVSARY